MKPPRFLALLPRLIAGLGCLGSALAQTQKQPTVSYDPQTDLLQLDWQSPRNRTFFPQVSTGLDLWNYVGSLHFGPGTHTGIIQTNAPRAFFRLQHSDLPVVSESEAESADFDADGLSNLVELQVHGTDPLNKDTDRDGLPDGWEVAHSIDPRDDGSIDPANGPGGIFHASAPSSGEGGLAPRGATTNHDAYSAGVQGHPQATLADKDGDGLPDLRDAGPLSRCIDWETDGSQPRFIYQAIPGYDYAVHGSIVDCNDRGDLVAEKAVFIDGVWRPLAQIEVNSNEALKIKMRVAEREHEAYVRFQPNPMAITDDGRIVGSGEVLLRSVEEEVSPGIFVSHEAAGTRLAFIWDSWSSTPRPILHARNTTLAGNSWDEWAAASPDGYIAVSQRVGPSTPAHYRLIQLQGTLPFGVAGNYPAFGTLAMAQEGFSIFQSAGNAYSWSSASGAPRSLLADSQFASGSSVRPSFHYTEPALIGAKPGASGAHALNFWDRTMIHHEGRWQEAVELGDADLLTRQGIAFYRKGTNSVEVWKGGQRRSLASSVVNADFSPFYVTPYKSISDGRVLIQQYGVEGMGYGFLVPVPDLVSRDKYLAGSFELPHGWDSLEMEFVGPNGENLGKYGNLLGGGATKIYNEVTDILNQADFIAGSQSEDQKVWFVKNPTDPRKIDYYTCFNAVGNVEIRLYLGGSSAPVAVVPHVLVAEPQFAATIAYVDGWVKGSLFDWADEGGPPLGLTGGEGSPMSSNFNGANDGIHYLTRACLIPHFVVIDQVEGLGSVSIGLFDGVKSGLEDDWEFCVLLGKGIGITTTWAYQQAKLELQEWRTNPLKRAAEFAVISNQINEDLVFKPLRQIREDLSTWEGFKKRAFVTMGQALYLGVKVSTSGPDVWGAIVDGLTSWGDDFCDRMIEGSEKAHWFNVPWRKDKLLQDIANPSRLACYTLGYTFGYLGEQVVVGVLSGGTLKIGQAIRRGGPALASALSLRSSGVVAARAQMLKRLLDDGIDLTRPLFQAYERDFAMAAAGPVGENMPRVAIEVMQEGVAAGKLVWKDFVGDLTTKPNLDKLVKDLPGKAIMHKRFSQLMEILGPDFDHAIGRNFMKIADEIILVAKPDGTVDDFFEAFFRAFQGNPSLMTHANDATFSIASLSPQGKATLKKFLSDPNPGKLWDIDVPAFVGDEPAVPHNYWIRGLLGELVLYKREYERLGYIHAPTAKAFDYKLPDSVDEGLRELVQVKTVSNPGGASQRMKKALDDLLALTQPPSQQPVRLHILKKPGISSDALEAFLENYIASLELAPGKIILKIDDFDLVP